MAENYARMAQMVAFSPEEQDAITAHETSPGTQRELEAAMRAEPDPAKRRVLGQLYARDFQGMATSGAEAPAAPRLSLSEFLGSKPSPAAAGAAAPGPRLSMLDFLNGVQVPQAPPPPSSFMRRAVGDTAIALGKGIIAVPETAVGLADIATGGRVGKALENEGGDFGFRPKEARAALDENLSPEQQQANANVQKAEGFVDTAAQAFKNPSVVMHSVVESLPSMLAGGVTGRALVKLAPSISGAVAGAFGEGVVSAGQTAEQVRQETKDGLLTPEQAAIASASGAFTGLLGVVAGKVAHGMGIHDIDTLVAGKGEPTVQKSFLKQVLQGAFTEGVLEELPQSVQEQVAQNLSLGKPIDEGIPQAAVLGTLSGGLMGGGAQMLGGKKTAGDEVRDTKVPESGPLTRAANAGIEVEAKIADTVAANAVVKEPLDADAAKALLDMANTRAAELETKAKGTKDEKKGGKTVKGTPAQFLTPDEKAELEFLKEHGGDVGQLELRYGKETAETPPAAAGAPAAQPAGAGAAAAAAPAVAKPAAAPAVASGQDTAAAPNTYAALGASRDPEQALRFMESQAARDEKMGKAGGYIAAKRAKNAAAAKPVETAPAQNSEPPPGETPVPSVVRGDAAGPFKSRKVAERKASKIPGATVEPTDAGFVLRVPLTAQAAAAETAAKMQQGSTTSVIDENAHGSAESPHNDLAPPTAEQAKVGNYQLGHDNVTFPGLDLSIENPAGSTRKDKNNTPPKWETLMSHHYGYVKGSVGADKDHVDVFVKPGTPVGHTGPVFVVDQRHRNGRFDEHKVMMGFDNVDEARAAYLSNYEPGWTGLKAITPMSYDDFKAWVRDPVKTKQEAAKLDAQEPAPAAAEAAPAQAADEGTTAPAGTGEAPARSAVAGPAAVQADGVAERPAKPRMGETADEVWAAIKMASAGVVSREAGSRIVYPTLRVVGGDDFRLGPHNKLEVVDRKSGGRGTRDATEAEANEFHHDLSEDRVQVLLMTAPGYGSSEKAQRAVQELHSPSGLGFKGKTSPAATSSAPSADEVVATPEGDKGPRVRLAKKRAEKVAASEKPAQQAPKPAEKIEDFGETLHGARKHYAEAFRDRMNDAMSVDVATEPLSKSWPEPDYPKLLEAGTHPWTVAFVRAVRDAIPTKPQTSWKLKGWIEKVKTLRGLANELLSGEVPVEKVRAQMDTDAFRRLGAHMNGAVDLYLAVGHAQSLKGIELHAGSYSMFAGKKYDPPKLFWTVERQTKGGAFGNWPRQFVMAETRADAIAQFKAKVDSLNLGGKERTTSYDIYTKRTDKGAVFIGKKIGRDYVDLKRFDSVALARAFMAEHRDELDALLERYKAVPFERRETNEPRVGADHRAGARMTPEVFADTFGFRGVQFGNYVEDSRRQKDLNDAYDGLMDLAGIVGVPPRALSLNGTLGLAFGARGKGGKRAPSAHFEPDTIVINLTKVSGAGSLAHEWFHAVDNYFARIDGKTTDFATLASKAGAIRPEVFSALQAVVKAIRSTKLPARSNLLDRRRTTPYWGTTIEMAARSFESYVVAKLQDQNASNDYLANLVSEGAFGADMMKALLEGQTAEESYPYPTEAEMPVIRRAFDDLFAAIQTRETDKGVAMFQRKSTEPFYSELAKQIGAAKMATAPTQGWADFIKGLTQKGVKPDEVQWSGINEWLALQGAKVTKQQVLDFLAGNGVKVEEAVLGESPLPEGWTVMRDDEAGEFVLVDEVGDEQSRGDTEQEAIDNAQDEDAGRDTGEATKYATYQLPGGKDYRELLLTLPENGAESAAQEKRTAAYTAYDHGEITHVERDRRVAEASHEASRRNYVSGHWTHHHPNVLAHIRFNERTDAQGNRVLFIEEIQSDWAQEGKRSGFVGDLIPQNREWGQADHLDTFTTREAAEAAAKEHTADLKQEDDIEKRIAVQERGGFFEVVEEWRSANESAPSKSGVPRAPFVGKTDAWVALAIKRATKWAVDHGFDRVAFVNGEQSADRYDLSKQVKSISWTSRRSAEFAPRNVTIAPISGNDIEFRVLADGQVAPHGEGSIGNEFDGKNIADIVGKEIGEKILNDVTGDLSGNGLKVGGDGMRAFYDSIVPKVAKEVVRKLGGDGLTPVRLQVGKDFETRTREQAAQDGGWIGRREVPVMGDQLGFDITDKMIAAAEGGVPLFQRNEGKVASMRRRLTQEVADAITSGWSESPPVVVIGSMDEAPASARRENEAQLSKGADGSPAAFIVGGKVYLVASQMKTTKDVATALFHEVLGHHGLHGVFGPTLDDVLKTVAAGRPEALAAKASEYGLDINNDEHRLIAAEELLAELAQTKPKATLVQRAIAAIRTWLREHVPMFKNLALSDAEIIRNFITPARRFVETGGGRAFQDTQPDVHFQRVGAALMGAKNRAREVQLPAGYLVGDLFNSAGKVGWWHKSFGTPFNLAKRSPLFKRVYDSVQNFLNDVSYYAIESADLAPRILPKLETWMDIAKSPLSAADTKAIAAPIFEGTLIWTRDADGKPVKVADLESHADTLTVHDKAHKLYTSGKLTEGEFKRWRNLPIAAYEGAIANRYAREFLSAGVVWSDAELKSMFGMTDGEKGTIGLYREFRKAVDHSLKKLAISDMLRFGGQDVAALREQALATASVDEAAVMLRDHLFKLAAEDAARASVLNDTANKMIDKADRANDLMAKGYAPLSRFGTYSLDVVGADGTREYFGLFESARERSRMARQMRAMHPGAAVTEGTVSQEAFKLFAGVSPETLELFGGMLGLEAQGDDASSKAFQTFIKLAKSNRSAMKRLIERKGIAGFSEDAGRVLAGFVYSNARQTSSNLHMGEMTQAAHDIPQAQGELKDQAVKLTDYVKNPQEEAHRVKAILFAQYLGGSVAAALVNMTQPLAVTFPFLSQYGGVNKARRQMVAAIADSMKKSTGDAALDAALKKAAEEGIVSPQEVHQLLAQSMGRASLKSGDGTAAGDAAAKTSNFLSKLALGWGKVFGIAEQANRRITFIAAYRTAVDQGMANPAEFAANAVNETQFTYNKGNKPMAARGMAGSVLMTFKQYSISYLELVNRMWTQGGPEGKRAALLAMAVLFFMGGADGLPFADDADDVIDGAMQHLGYNFSTKQAKREFFASILGRDGAQFVSKGMSGLPGVPIDVSGRLGMGNIIPATGLLTKKTDHTSDVAELAGPIGDLGKRVVQAGGQAFTGDLGGALTTIAPKAAQNLAKAYDMANTGMYRDERGRKVIDVDGFEAVAKGLGFQPNSVARVQEATREVQQAIGLNKMREAEIADKWAQGMFEHDPAKVQEARDELAAWNSRNPESRIVINSAQIRRRVQQMGMSKADRIAKTAPKEIRATVKAELEAAR